MLHIIFLNSRLKEIDMELLSNKYVTLFGLKNLNNPKKSHLCHLQNVRL